MNSQFVKAQELSSTLKNNLPTNATMRITGHSLGGELASIGALQTGVPTYTYNSAGLHPKIIEQLDLDINNEKYITAFHTNKDALNTFQDNRNLYAGLLIPALPILEPISVLGFQHSAAATIGATLFGDDLPKAIGNRIQLPTNTGHSISHLKEISEAIISYYEK